MPTTTLFDDGTHRNLLLDDPDRGLAVQANVHLIVHDGHGMLLDPGGHKIYGHALAETLSVLENASRLRFIFLSHQDPDIVAATNGWLMTTEADAYVSALWLRFVPHFGIDALVEDRLKPIPDEGMTLDLRGSELVLVPAHFLHAAGNFQVYDPVARILYTGDLGASLGMEYREVADFDAHLQYMEGFHRRYMAAGAMMRSWARMARTLDIETIAPQHGAVFRGRELVERFIDWVETVECGVDLLADRVAVPEFRR